MAGSFIPLAKVRYARDGRALVRDVPIFRCGVYLDPRDGWVLHAPWDVARAAPTFDGAPLTPAHSVTYPVGQVDNVRLSGDRLLADVEIFNFPIIDSLRSGIGNRGLSVGYRSKLVPRPGVWRGIAYDGFYTDIRADHVAIIRRGDAGPTCALPRGV